jgi:hypothetical protein
VIESGPHTRSLALVEARMHSFYPRDGHGQ